MPPEAGNRSRIIAKAIPETEKLGFATPSFFIRFFRQQTGLTPLQYRKLR